MNQTVVPVNKLSFSQSDWLKIGLSAGWLGSVEAGASSNGILLSLLLKLFGAYGYKVFDREKRGTHFSVNWGDPTLPKNPPLPPGYSPTIGLADKTRDPDPEIAAGVIKNAIRVMPEQMRVDVMKVLNSSDKEAAVNAVISRMEKQKQDEVESSKQFSIQKEQEEKNKAIADSLQKQQEAVEQAELARQRQDEEETAEIKRMLLEDEANSTNAAKAKKEQERKEKIRRSLLKRNEEAAERKLMEMYRKEEAAKAKKTQ